MGQLSLGGGQFAVLIRYSRLFPMKKPRNAGLFHWEDWLILDSSVDRSSALELSHGYKR